MGQSVYTSLLVPCMQIVCFPLLLLVSKVKSIHDIWAMFLDVDWIRLGRQSRSNLACPLNFLTTMRFIVFLKMTTNELRKHPLHVLKHCSFLSGRKKGEEQQLFRSGRCGLLETSPRNPGQTGSTRRKVQVLCLSNECNHFTGQL